MLINPLMVGGWNMIFYISIQLGTLVPTEGLKPPTKLIGIYNPPWKNLYKIDHLGVRFYRDEAGRPEFTIEW